MKLSIYGASYVGLVTAACFAEMGNHVLCVDIDDEKIAKLKEGIAPIYEPGLDELLKKNLSAGRLLFTTNSLDAVAYGEYQFIAVGTPSQEDGSADLTHVLAVANTIAENMKDYRLIINKSTVPVGTADCVHQAIQKVLDIRHQTIPFDVVSNPEFLKEGAAVNDFMRPDRIIVGSEDLEAIEKIRLLYAPFNRNHDKFFGMSTRSAELTKYASNAMLATKISFMNEISNLAERLGADIEEIRQGMGADARIGYHFTYAGCGFGGSCFPKDLRALCHTAENAQYDAELLKAIVHVNRRQKQKLFEKIEAYYHGHLRGRTFALWGLAFKPNTDDMREAASRVLLESLWEAGARVNAYDPVAMHEAKRIYGERDDFTLCFSPEAALDNADALIIVTEWNAFRSPDFASLKQTLKEPVIFDGRNLYDPQFLKKQGFIYYGIGRGVSTTQQT